MGTYVEAALAALLPYLTLPNAIGLVLIIVGGAVTLTKAGARTVARQAVAAAYRNALKAAEQLQETGVAWLTSEDGAAYRKAIVNKAYDALPTTVYGLPVGVLVTAIITREAFARMVDQAFVDMLQLAARLDLDGDGV